MPLLLKQELIELAQMAAQRNWVPATSGNFSERIDTDKFLVSASGKNKANLSDADFVEVKINDDELSSYKPKPSAETILHSYLYRTNPAINAVAHVHSRNSVLLSLLSEAEELKLSSYELLKAIGDIKTHETTIRVPIFANTQRVEDLAKEVQSYMQEENPDVYAYLIKGHGLYTWGRSITEVQRHLEAFDMIFELELSMRQVKHV